MGIEYNRKLYGTVKDLWRHPHCLVATANHLGRRLKKYTVFRAIRPDYYMCWGKRFNLLREIANDPRCEVSEVTLRKRMAMMVSGVKLAPETCVIAKPTGVLEYLVSEVGRPKPCFLHPGQSLKWFGEVTDMLARRAKRKISLDMRQTSLPQDLGIPILCHLWLCENIHTIEPITSETQWISYRHEGYRLVPEHVLRSLSLRACRYDMRNVEPRRQISIDTGSLDISHTYYNKPL